jgi:hypothetical protein
MAQRVDDHQAPAVVLVPERLTRTKIARTGVLVPRLDDQPILVGQQPKGYRRPVVQSP